MKKLKAINYFTLETEGKGKSGKWQQSHFVIHLLQNLDANTEHSKPSECLLVN